MYRSTGLFEKVIIFICALLIYLTQTEKNINVLMVLISVIFSGFLSYFDDDRIRSFLTLGFSILSFFIPDLIFFMPVMVFDMLLYKYQYINLIAVIPLISFYQSASIQVSFTILIMIIFCIGIRYRLEEQTKLQTKLSSFWDATREMSIQLEKRNSDLIEKQDNELNIATLNERNRIARDIHDNVGHLLSSAILQSGALLTINKDEKIKDNLETLNDTLNKAMNSIRSSVHELYDESIDLNAQLQEIKNQFTFCELKYDYRLTGNAGKKLKYAFVSIIKEALSNIIKHSNATSASIIFREHPAFYQLIIRDNGVVKNYNSDDGLGLKNMADRVNLLKGNINIMTECGFEIFISIPKEGPTE